MICVINCARLFLIKGNKRRFLESGFYKDMKNSENKNEMNKNIWIFFSKTGSSKHYSNYKAHFY